LGLTLNCCRCHDHKYDPLARREYYELFAFFDQTPVTGKGRDPQTEPVLEVPSEEQTKESQRLRRAIDPLNEQIREPSRAIVPLEAAWEPKRLYELQRDDNPSRRAGEPLPLVDALVTAPELRSEAQRKSITDAHRESDPDYVHLRKARERLQNELTDLRKEI